MQEGNQNPVFPFKLIAPAIWLYMTHTDANAHLLHSKWVSLIVVQVYLQVEEGVEEYVGHPTALQVTKGYLTWRKQQIHKQTCE